MVHQCETGQWKNVLQQHAQKLKFPLPNYTCEKSGDDHSPTFVSTVEVGGIFCTGGIAKSKKAAEMKAARKAFVAIQDQACMFIYMNISLWIYICDSSSVFL
jgi:dsRNA-specific ribonuclease